MLTLQCKCTPKLDVTKSSTFRNNEIFLIERKDKPKSLVHLACADDETKQLIYESARQEAKRNDR